LGKADPNSKPKETFFQSPSKTEKTQFIDTKSKFNNTFVLDEKAQTYTKPPDKNTA